jgi:surface antigen
MRKWLVAGGMVAACVVIGAGLGEAGTPDATIKAVMKDAMKGGLLKKVTNGQGNDDDKKQLLTKFESLTKAKPPMGDDASWKNKTDALVTAAKDVVDNKPDGAAKLKNAANCKACHDTHKGQ